MTTFAACVLLALTAIEIILMIHSYVVIKELKAAREDYRRILRRFDDVVDNIYRAKLVVDQTNAKIDGIIPASKKLLQNSAAIEQAVKDLLAFETRHEQRNDEMFARCEEINKLQLEQLRAKVHTHGTETLPPVDVVGVTATGICQECNGKSICKHYDVNRNICFVADKNTTNKE